MAGGGPAVRVSWIRASVGYPAPWAHYQEFLARAAASRTHREQIEQVAQGRVWTDARSANAN